MVQTQCPVCHEVGGFHNRLTHDSTVVPADSRLPSGWLKQYLDEQKARLAESVSTLSGIPVAELEELGGFAPAEVKMVTISQETLIQLVVCALAYDSRLPYGAIPQEVLQLLPEEWLERYRSGDLS